MYLPFLLIRLKEITFCLGNYAFSSKAIPNGPMWIKLARQDLGWQVLATSQINKKTTGNFTVQATICNDCRSNMVLYTCLLASLQQYLVTMSIKHYNEISLPGLPPLKSKSSVALIINLFSYAY